VTTTCPQHCVQQLTSTAPDYHLPQHLETQQLSSAVKKIGDHQAIPQQRTQLNTPAGAGQQ
jgi:hypothetical protein